MAVVAVLLTQLGWSTIAQQRAARRQPTTTAAAQRCQNAAETQAYDDSTIDHQPSPFDTDLRLAPETPTTSGDRWVQHGTIATPTDISSLDQYTVRYTCDLVWLAPFGEFDRAHVTFSGLRPVDPFP